MLRRDDHERYAEHGVRTGGVDAQCVVTVGEREIDKRALGTADPVFLLQANIREIIDVV